MPSAKSIFASKTFWLNALALATVVLTALLGTDLVSHNPQSVLWLGAALAVANVVLRFFTASPVSLTGDSSMKAWILLAVVASLCFAGDANAFGPASRTKTTTVKNTDGSVTTVRATTPIFFPLLRGPKLQVTQSQSR